MRKMRTRIGSILLACAMLLTFSTVSVFAVDSEQEEPNAAGQEVMSEETSQPASNAAADTDAPALLTGEEDSGDNGGSGLRTSSVLNIADGSIVLGNGTYTQENGEELQIPDEGLVISGTSNENTITVDPGEGLEVSFTINGLDLTTSTGASLIDVRSGSAKITLAGENTLTNSAESMNAVLRVSGNQALSIEGDGSLTIHNGTDSAAAHGAAMGGSAGEAGGTITIKSGTIHAEQYGPGAGVGGGGPTSSTGGTGDSGNISIEGGMVQVSVQAVDNYGGGCGIGPGINYYTVPSAGRDGIANTIVISGGTVEAEAKNKGSNYSGAAIGTGRIGATDKDSLIHITGDANVKATTYGASAAIGASVVSSTLGGTSPEGVSKILIDGNSRVEAQTVYTNIGLYCGAAIGMGANGFVSPWEIEITGNAVVKATGGEVGAGIGSAIASTSSQSDLSITIGDSANVTAVGKDYAAGIGTSMSVGDTSAMTEITIKDQAVVNATGGYGAAAIGSGSGFTKNNSGNITITGTANVTATGGTGASAIGAGDSGKVAGTTSITAGTTVIAYADGSKFAIDVDTTGSGKVNVTDTVLNGRFAEGEVTPADSSAEDTESPINLLKDGAVDCELTIPADYRAFAVTASDGEANVRVQNGENANHYAYYTEDTGAKQINYPLYETVHDGSNVMLTKDELRWMPIVELTPADITIYMGGAGYDGVVDENGANIGSDNGLPEAGFYIMLPEDLNAQLKEALGADPAAALDLSPYLSFSNGTKTWTIERYDGEETSAVNGKYIYRLVAADGQDPVRMQFTDAEGTVHISDTFDLVNALYNRYTMEIYPGAVEQNTVYAEIDTDKVTQAGGDVSKISYTTYAAVAYSGSLTIRGVTQSGTTTAIVEQVDKAVSNITAVLPADTTYTINDSDVQVVDGAPALLVDEIVSPDNTQNGKDFRTLLTNKAVETAAKDFQNVASEARYLDLVDAANGNTWIKADKPVTIYWPYPDGTDANTQFRLVHFVGMDREMTTDEAESKIETATVETISVKTDAYGISFTTDSFSPFVLMWDNTQTTTVTEEQPDEHPDIAEAKENGTWGQPTPTPAAASVIPQTSDDMPLGLLIGLAVVAVVAIVVLIVLRKRRKR